jgi:ABC-2 type transport system permease protein
MSTATVTLPAARTAGRRSALANLALVELKLYLRERLRLFFGVGFPLMLTIIIGAIPSFNKPEAAYGGRTFLDVYVPIMVAFTAALLSLTALPMMLASYRERGVLRRLETTPIGPARVLAAQLLANLAVAVVTMVAVLLLARFGFGVPLPRELGGFAIAALLALLALMCVGLFIAAVVPSAKAAQATGALLFYPLMFFAGLWLPIANMPAWLQHVSHATPLGAAVQALTDSAAGHWPTALQLGTLAAYAVAFGLAAAKTFRWE